jgi:hypothetical protein
LANLTSLTNLNIGWNALSVDSLRLVRFLREKDEDWYRTQTVPPKVLAALPDGSRSIQLCWLPISYKEDPGGYRIYYSRSPFGHFTFYQQTVDKTVASMKVTGLSPGARYYFKIQTRTEPHEYPGHLQQNLIDSDFSWVVSAMTAGGRR